MPHISQNFSHVLESHTKTTAGAYNYTSSLQTNSYAYKEVSQCFFDDLKSMLETIEGLGITFSENLVYTNGIQAPYFKIWDLEFSPFVVEVSTHANSYSLMPSLIRHYEYSPNAYSLREFQIISNNASTDISTNGAIGFLGRINKNATEKTDVNYTIDIYYNVDYLIISYIPYNDQYIKNTLCCVIKV